jgi:hypothetical protein
MREFVPKTSAFRMVTVAGRVGVVGFAVLMGLSLLQERSNRVDHARLEIENMTSDELLSRLKQLATQLKSKSLGARHLAEEIGDMMDDSQHVSEFADVLQSTQRLRYDTALASLERLLDHHGWLP